MMPLEGLSSGGDGELAKILAILDAMFLLRFLLIRQVKFSPDTPMRRTEYSSCV